VSEGFRRGVVAALTALLWTSAAIVVASSAGAVQDHAWDATHARDEARDILSERRFRGLEPPRPFEGALRRVAEWVESVRAFLRGVAVGFPGGTRWLVAVAGIGLAAAIAWIVVRGTRRRQRVRDGRAARTPTGGGDDPAALEARADQSARRGDFNAAVRLRFRAGLLRLHRARAIDLRPSITTGEIARRLSSPAFEDLAASFEAVAYGGRRAKAEDVERASMQWTRVLAQRGAK
jgi:hypothetical protein